MATTTTLDGQTDHFTPYVRVWGNKYHTTAMFTYCTVLPAEVSDFEGQSPFRMFSVGMLSVIDGAWLVQRGCWSQVEPPMKRCACRPVLKTGKVADLASESAMAAALPVFLAPK